MESRAGDASGGHRPQPAVREWRVRLKLFKGNVDVVGRKSPYSLFDEKIATFEEDHGTYDQADAEGFIKLNALRLRNLARKRSGS